MSQVRRRVLRPQRAPAADPRRAARLEKLRQQLEGERAAVDRWMAKLKRAFRAVLRGQKRVARLERRLQQLDAA